MPNDHSAQDETFPLPTARRIAPTERILVVSLDNLGDLVFTSALTRQLRDRFPDAEITLWCKQYTAAIGPLLPGVDVVEAAEPFWDRAPGGRKGSVLAFAASVLRLRRRRFDVAILAAAPWRTAAATFVVGARRRIGLARRRNAAFLTDVLPAEDVELPVLAEMARLLEPVGIAPPTPLRYELEVEPIEERRERLRSSLGARPAALHPFASKRNRCVSLDEWIRTAAELQRRGYDPLWIGSAAELREVHRAAGSATWRYVDQLGDGTLADTAAALSLAHLFIGHDSGPLHVAGAFGVPVVGVFTPGEPLRTFPQGVGPARMLGRESPAGVTSEDLIALVDELPAAPPLRLMR
ncbi:MAG: ADP-heptose--lipooligosaccharide heptosyltransferase [Gemmatimonadetes bacterium]|nr:ADP-heptose--lipooligosaccharide heptosyltransferase [Gemmatimonadota bacterium]